MIKSRKDKGQRRPSEKRRESSVGQRQPMTEAERAEAERLFEAMFNGEWVRA